MARFQKYVSYVAGCLFRAFFLWSGVKCCVESALLAVRCRQMMAPADMYSPKTTNQVVAYSATL